MSDLLSRPWPWDVAGPLIGIPSHSDGPIPGHYRPIRAVRARLGLHSIIIPPE